MEELITGTGPGQKTTLLTGLWCLFVYPGLVKQCLVPTELCDFKPSSFQDFQNFPVWFLRHCRLVWRLQVTLCWTGYPFLTKQASATLYLLLQHQILRGKSRFPCGILYFKRQFYIHRLPQWKYKLCEVRRAVSAHTRFGRQPPLVWGEERPWKNDCRQSPMTAVSALIDITLTNTQFC